jgi:hypothetical protein
MAKIPPWVVTLLKTLLPAAREDPVAASLGVLAIVAETARLSEWQFWLTSTHGLYIASPLLLLAFLWRQKHRSWKEASLSLAVAVLMLLILVSFAYSVPFRILSITVVELLVTAVLVVRYHP